MNRGFILYESLIIFIIISSLLLTSLNVINNIYKENKILEKEINLKFKTVNSDDGKVCDYLCLIKKALSH